MKKIKVTQAIHAIAEEIQEENEYQSARQRRQTGVITIFNRKELTITFSMEEQSRIRNLLSAQKIDYTIKFICGSSSRARMGPMGGSMAIAHESIFYVHKNDYQMAQAVIANEYMR